MAASQVRLLQLTSRKNTIGRSLESLSLQKTSLSRDMQRVSKNYQEALNSKTLKWSNNSGITYVDLSYSNLMRPNAYNNNTPYLLTNQNGGVVINKEYEEYAKMISEGGGAGGDYESNRTKILASVTGISAEKIEKSKTTSATVNSSAENIKKLQEEVDKLKSKATIKYTNTKFFENCLGNIQGFNTQATIPTNSVSNDYKNSSATNSANWKLADTESSAKSRLTELFKQLKTNAESHLTEEDYKKFEEACDQTYTEYCTYIDQANNATNNTTIQVSKFSNVDNSYCIRVDLFLNDLMRNYEKAGGTTSFGNTNTTANETFYSCVDRNSTAYQNYVSKKAELDTAKSEHNTVVDTDNQVLTSSEESQIAFYDQLFTAIAENGWECNYQIDDNNYLNQMLQNNQYYVTTMATNTDDNSKQKYEYHSTIASNMDNIFTVNDSATMQQAQADYEYEKNIINSKESRIDQRMQNLETEQSAINEMIKGIESVRNKNVETNFAIFS